MGHGSSTNCVHKGNIFDKVVQGAISPIYPATSFGYLDIDKLQYPRYFNIPNQIAVQEKVAALEKAESALLLSSGMAAISSTFLTLLKSGDHALVQKNIYGGTSNMLNTLFPKYNINFDYVEDCSHEGFLKHIRKETKVIYFETPSNPMMDIVGLTYMGQISKEYGIPVVIDSTFASPINQNPITYGVDIVLHSATKYMGGHSDICAGIVAGKEAHIEKIKETAICMGGSLNAQTCYLLERSLKTLAVRVKKQNKNAMDIAHFLSEQKGIKKVYYPGLATHKQHSLAKEQMRGFGGMVSFELTEEQNVIAFQKHLHLILPSLSLGGVESTICSPYLTSHVLISEQDRKAQGISPQLLRLSVGIENSKDLIADLKKALEFSCSPK